MGAAPRADAGAQAREAAFQRRQDGLVESVSTRLQRSAVHRETHRDHLVDILEHLQGLGSRERGVAEVQSISFRKG